jgi:hypothetical protein
VLVGRDCRARGERIARKKEASMNVKRSSARHTCLAKVKEIGLLSYYLDFQTLVV